jgi:hypothetical protein
MKGRMFGSDKMVKCKRIQLPRVREVFFQDGSYVRRKGLIEGSRPLMLNE